MSQKIVFLDAESKDLPIGAHQPCLLESVKRYEPGDDQLKKWPDLKPSYCFRFVLIDPESELQRCTAVRFVNASSSKLGFLFQFVCDLNNGEAPETFDPLDYEGRWFRIRVRQKPDSEKLFVSGADPIKPPPGAVALIESGQSHAEPVTSSAGGDDGDTDIPF